MTTPKWIKRLTGPTTVEGYEYGVAGSPAVRHPDPETVNRTVEPDSLTVFFKNDRFDHVEIAGVLAHNEAVRCTLRFDKEQDLPDWANVYVTAHVESAQDL